MMDALEIERVEMAEKPGEACGLFAVWSPRKEDTELVEITRWGALGVENRGESGCGMGVFSEDGLALYHSESRASIALTEAVAQDLSSRNIGLTAFGHDRYSTSGGEGHVQPCGARDKSFAVIHNGNMVHVGRDAAVHGIDVSDEESDSFAATEFLEKRAEQVGLQSAIKELIRDFDPAFSMVVAEPDRLTGFRDKFGMRPLVYGKDKDGRLCFSSETSGMDQAGFQMMGEVAPGQIVILGAEGVTKIDVAAADVGKFCLFETVYFMKNWSQLNGTLLKDMRFAAGQRLAVEHPSPDSDLVVPVLGSGRWAGLGYADAAGLPVDTRALYRNPDVGRSFMHLTQEQREAVVRQKQIPQPEFVKGKRLTVVEDSIVRATNSRIIVEELFEAGAKEVHFRVASPPYKHPCYYGMDTSREPDRLVAAIMETEEEIRKHIGATSLGYLSLEGLLASVPDVGGYCDACFTGNYHTDTTVEITKR